MPAFDVVLHVTNVDVTPAEPPITFNETSLRYVLTGPINFDTAGLTAGVPIYTPAIGEWLVDAWPRVTVGFDGTTPFADIALGAGFTADTNVGIYGDVASAAIDVSTADVTDGNGYDSITGFGLPAGASQSLSSAFMHAGSAPWTPPRFATTDPLLCVVSQDGKKGGAAVGGAAGTLYWVLAIGTAEPPITINGGGGGTSLALVSIPFNFDVPNIYDDAGIIGWTPDPGTLVFGATFSPLVSNDAAYNLGSSPTFYMFLDGDPITDYKLYGAIDVAGNYDVVDTAGNTQTTNLTVAAWGDLVTAIYAGTPIRVGINDATPIPSQPTSPATVGEGTFTFVVQLPAPAEPPITISGGLVPITLPLVESGWDNSGGAWVFNGDGTATSTAVAGHAVLATPAAAGAILAADITLVASLAAGSGNVGLHVTNAAFDGRVAGVELFIDSPTSYYAGGVSINGAVAATTARTTWRAVVESASAVGLRNGVLDGWGINTNSVAYVDAVVGLYNPSGVAGSVVDLSACSVKVASLA